MNGRRKRGKIVKSWGLICDKNYSGSFENSLVMHFSVLSCQHMYLKYMGWVCWSPTPSTKDIEWKMHFPHFSDKNKRCVCKNAHNFFSQSFRQSRPLNYFCLVITLIEKTQIKSIADHGWSFQFFGDWIPAYRGRQRREGLVKSAIFQLQASISRKR